MENSEPQSQANVETGNARDIRPTAREERLAHHLANVHSCRLRRRPVEWRGSLDVSWQERQAWFFVARAALLSLNAKQAPSVVSGTDKQSGAQDNPKPDSLTKAFEELRDAWDTYGMCECDCNPCRIASVIDKITQVLLSSPAPTGSQDAEFGGKKRPTVKPMRKTQKSQTQRSMSPRHEWNQTQPMWVIGTIDNYGAIRGRAADDDSMHEPGDGNGRRWRWNVWGAEFHAVLGGRNQLTLEECEAVEDWLSRKGYIHPDKQGEIEQSREHRRTLHEA